MDQFANRVKGQPKAVDQAGGYLFALRAAQRQDRFLVLRGGAMTGKTSLARASATALGRPLFIQNADVLSDFEELLESLGKKKVSEMKS
jgi:hypothetical protein